MYSFYQLQLWLRHAKSKKFSISNSVEKTGLLNSKSLRRCEYFIYNINLNTACFRVYVTAAVFGPFVGSIMMVNPKKQVNVTILWLHDDSAIGIVNSDGA